MKIMMFKKTIQNDLKNGLSIQEVCTNYNLTFKELVNIAHKDIYTDVSKVERVKRVYIYPYRNSPRELWSIQKNNMYFGLYSTLDDAIKVRDCLIKRGWNKKELDCICQKLGVTRLVRK